MCNSMLKQSRPIKMLTFIPLARVERLDCDERLEKRCRKRTAAFCVCESVCVCVCVCVRVLQASSHVICGKATQRHTGPELDT